MMWYVHWTGDRDRIHASVQMTISDVVWASPLRTQFGHSLVSRSIWPPLPSFNSLANRAPIEIQHITGRLSQGEWKRFDPFKTKEHVTGPTGWKNRDDEPWLSMLMLRAINKLVCSVCFSKPDSGGNYDSVRSGGKCVR